MLLGLDDDDDEEKVSDAHIVVSFLLFPSGPVDDRLLRNAAMRCRKKPDVSDGWCPTPYTRERSWRGRILQSFGLFARDMGSNAAHADDIKVHLHTWPH